MLNIVTRFVREPKTMLDAVYGSLCELLNGQVAWNWFPVGPTWDEEWEGKTNIRFLSYAKPEPGDYGCLMNHYLDYAQPHRQWVHFIDADNLPHPGLLRIAKQIAENPSWIDDTAFVVVDQQRGPHSFLSCRTFEDLAVQRVDLAQVIFNRNFIGSLRSWNVYRHDGYFIQELAIRAREQRMIVRIKLQTACYWNKQRWNEDSTSPH